MNNFSGIANFIWSVADLAAQARSNTMEKFRFGFNEKVINMWIDRMGQNTEFFHQVMDNPKFSALVNDYVMRQVYQRLRAAL